MDYSNISIKFLTHFSRNFGYLHSKVKRGETRIYRCFIEKFPIGLISWQEYFSCVSSSSTFYNDVECLNFYVTTEENLMKKKIWYRMGLEL